MKHRLGGTSISVCLIAIAAGGLALTRQAPTFRAGVDLIAIDVQVVDKDGHPVFGLTAPDFHVAMGGRARRVVSADLMRYDSPGTPGSTSQSGSALTAVGGQPTRQADAVPPRANGPENAGRGRYLIMAIDASSFNAASSSAVVKAAKGFVDRLAPIDRVGVFTYPLGPKLDPTTQHEAVDKALDQLTGQEVPQTGHFHFSPSELVDLAAGDSDAAAQICGGSAPSTGDRDIPGDLLSSCRSPGCSAQARCQAGHVIVDIEASMQSNLGMLENLFKNLGKVAGRKVVVLVSAGEPVTDRPGGRPDIGMLPTELGQEAAEADVTLYTLFIDHSLIEQGLAENRTGMGGANQARNGHLLSRWLELFSGTAGGSFLSDAIGDGEDAYDRILNETSAYYLLGVEPEASDRDGHPHKLQITVDRHNVVLRSRTWTLVPRNGAATDDLNAAGGTALAPTNAPAGTARHSAPFAATIHTPAAASKLAAWMDAVTHHAPGSPDDSVNRIADWSRADLDTALLPLTARGSQPVADPASLNTILKRGAMLHTDIAMSRRTQTGYALPSDGRELLVVKDGAAVGRAGGTFHWEVARSLLDAIQPSPSQDAFARQWYRATAAALQRAGDYAELEPHLFHARQLFPSDAVLLLDTGTMEEGFVKPRLPEAEAFYRQGLALDPTLTEARIRLANVLGLRGAHAEAVAELDRALISQPAGLLRYYALLILAREDQGLGQTDGARTAATEAATLYPAAESPRLILSELATDAGDPAAALATLEFQAAPSLPPERDPWLNYHRTHVPDADTLLAQLRDVPF